MTNKEYIEKNNISFSKAMKMWDNKTSCINDWLNQEYQAHKFKVGDFVIQKDDNDGQGDNDGLGVVVDVADKVYYKWLKRNGTFDTWNLCTGDDKYHRFEHDVFYMMDESTYEKIF